MDQYTLHGKYDDTQAHKLSHRLQCS